MPFEPANVFSSVPTFWPSSSSCSNSSGDDRAGLAAARPTGAGPRARRPCSSRVGSGRARARAGSSSCRPRSGRGRPSGRARGRCRTCGSAGSRARCSRRILTATPRGRRAAAGRAGARRAASAASSRVQPDASSSAIRAFEVADERAGDRVRRGQRRPRSGPATEPSRTRTLRNEPVERVSISTGSRSSSSRRTPTSRTSRTRSGSARAARSATSAGWLSTVAASISSLLEPGPADLSLGDRDASACRPARRARRGAPCRRGPGRGRPARARPRRRSVTPPALPVCVECQWPSAR